MDKERQVYKLKEPSLAEVIALSLGIHKKNEAYTQLTGWRKQHGGVFADNVKQARAARRARRRRALTWRAAQVVEKLKLTVLEPRTTVKEVSAPRACSARSRAADGARAR